MTHSIMNNLERIRRIVKLRRSDWARDINRLLNDIPDYREIEKVECFPIKKGTLWSIHINGEPVGNPVYRSAYADHLSNWLHDNRALFNLIFPK